MAEEKILENHNVDTMEHEMKTQGCHLKEIKKKFLNELIIFRNSLISKHLTNFLQFSFRFSDKTIKKGDFLKIINLFRLDKKTIYVHVRTIQDDKHGRHGRSLKVTEHFINENITDRTEETEMTSGEIIEFEKDWKKLWHPTMTQGQSANHE